MSSFLLKIIQNIHFVNFNLNMFLHLFPTFNGRRLYFVGYTLISILLNMWIILKNFTTINTLCLMSFVFGVCVVGVCMSVYVVHVCLHSWRPEEGVRCLSLSFLVLTPLGWVSWRESVNQQGPASLLTIPQQLWGHRPSPAFYVSAGIQTYNVFSSTESSLQLLFCILEHEFQSTVEIISLREYKLNS